VEQGMLGFKLATAPMTMHSFLVEAAGK
jgi:hypothetical protein